MNKALKVVGRKLEAYYFQTVMFQIVGHVLVGNRVVTHKVPVATNARIILMGLN